MENQLHYLGLVEIAELIRRREISSVEVTQAILNRIQALQPTLEAFTTVSSDHALRAAEAADTDLARGRWKGLLHGVPFAVKDLVRTEGIPTAAGGTVHREYVPKADATVMRRLKKAGGVPLGKLRTTEGAFASHHPDLPQPVNPWSPTMWTGVSSSGSGVATAAGLAYATLGTDTGGSIRMPSSQNGVTGIKPTWGKVSRHGVFELAPSMDHIGPMARSVADAAVVLSIIAGHDPKDSTSLATPTDSYEDLLTSDTVPTVGINWDMAAYYDDEICALLEQTIANVKEMGWSVVEVPLPDFIRVSADWVNLCAVEAAYVHREDYPEKASFYGPALKALLDRGRALSAVELQPILNRRREFSIAMEKAFSGIDVLLLPALGLSAPSNRDIANLGSSDKDRLPLRIPNAPIDMCGFPSVTLPGGFNKEGLPLGIQFVGKLHSERVITSAAHHYQMETDFHLQRPNV